MHFDKFYPGFMDLCIRICYFPVENEKRKGQKRRVLREEGCVC